MTGDKTITITITRDLQSLLVCALRMAADEAQKIIDTDPTNWDRICLKQPGQVRWLASYLERKLDDTEPEKARL